MKLSVLSNSKGALNKTIDVDVNGEILKTHPTPMTEGFIRHYDIGLSDLPKGLAKMAEDQSLCHGVVKGSKDGDQHDIVSARQHSLNPQPGEVSRTIDCTEFNGSHLSMLDHDPDGQCPHAYLSPSALLSLLAGIDSQWKDAGHCIVQSTSAGLSLDCVPISVNNYGYHLYFEAGNAEMLKEYMTAIFKLTVIAGHGWIKLSSNGAINVRSCFDGSVFSPERIDFTAPPTLKSKRLTQKRPDPQYYPGRAIDCLQSLNVDEDKYKAVIKALKNDPDIVQRSNELAARKASEISKERNIPIEKAHQLVKSQLGGNLHVDDTIIFQNYGAVSVADVIANYEKYDHEPCADPGETEYGTSKAIFYANGGEKFIIHSVLHWGRNYFLQGRHEDSTWSFEHAKLTLEKVDCDAGYATENNIFSLVEDILHHNKFTELEMDSIKDSIKKYLKINKGALDKVIKSASANDGDSKQELTHWAIAEKYREQHLHKQSEVVGSEGCLWIYNDKNGLYEQFLLNKIEDEVGKYFPGTNCKKGSDYKAIARLVYDKLCNNSFFSEAPYGVAAKSNFIRIADDLSIKYEPYTAGHRQRYKLAVDPIQKDAPLFLQYLNDTFDGPDCKQQIALLQQIMGALVTGTFSKLQMAVLLIGLGSNGKSVLLELLNNMFPPGAKCAISPSDLDKENYRAELLGKVINIIGDLDETRSLKASFKDIVGCDTQISARQLYREPFAFKPIAGHIFASNHFPKTEDHSHGFYRRWVILNFKNTVSDSKKIPNLGAKIAEQELPQVLAWALIGAEKLAKNNFILPLTISHKKEMEKWRSLKDSVYSFLNDDDVVECTPGSKTLKQDAFSAYRNWCGQIKQKAVGYHEFLQRCNLKFSSGRFSDKDRRHCFGGMRLK